MKHKKELSMILNIFNALAIVMAGISVFSNSETNKLTYFIYGATVGLWIATILVAIITAVYNKEQK